jgi:hypothetical protein
VSVQDLHDRRHARAESTPDLDEAMRSSLVFDGVVEERRVCDGTCESVCWRKSERFA